MSNLQLITTKHFNGNALDCYVEPEQEQTGDFWATREQIGTLLEYAEPVNAVTVIHKRNKERLDKFSTGVKLTQVEGGRTVTREVIVYSFKGLLEICRYSNQPKANDIMDWLWEVADELRRTGTYSVRQNTIQTSLSEDLKAVQIVLAPAGITGNQLTLALDKVYKSYMGRSALQVAGITLIAPTQNQLLTPTDIGRLYCMSARRVNELLAGAGYQHKIADKWEAIGDGTKYAVMQDTSKRHSDGTPIRQLKWDSSILGVVEELIRQAEEYPFAVGE